MPRRKMVLYAVLVVVAVIVAAVVLVPRLWWPSGPEIQLVGVWNVFRSGDDVEEGGSTERIQFSRNGRFRLYYEGMPTTEGTWKVVSVEGERLSVTFYKSGSSGATMAEGTIFIGAIGRLLASMRYGDGTSQQLLLARIDD